VPTDEDTNSWRGDIAIDDVIATQESVLEVTPQPFNDATPSPAASKTGTPGSRLFDSLCIDWLTLPAQTHQIVHQVGKLRASLGV